MREVRAVGAHEQPALVVEVADRALDIPAVAAQPGAVLALTAGDQRLDPALPELPPVAVVVVATIGDQPRRPLSWATDAAAHRRDRIDERQQLGDVVAVRRRCRPREREAAAVRQEVVLDAAPATVDRARPKPRAPFFAGT